MTRKDYNAIADILRTEREGWQRVSDGVASAVGNAAVGTVALRFADYAQTDNPRFDRDRFLIAAGVPR